MYRNSYQSGFFSVLYSCGASPLANWGMHVKHGYIRRVTDDEVKSLALEIAGTNVSTTFIYCPADRKKVLGIMLPFFIMIIKNMKKYFTFEITILDDKNMHRRFRVSNFQSTTKVRPFSTSMPIGLSGGWNQIQFNLADFTRRAYGTNYVETTRMQIHANCRIRRIYFSDRLYTEDETPEEFKLFLPMERKKCVREEDKKIKKPDEANVAQIMKSIPADEPPEFHVEETETEKPEMEVEAKVSKTSSLIDADDSSAQVQEETLQEEHKDVTDTESEEEEEGIDAPEDEQESMQMKEMIGTLEDATEESEFLSEEETEPEDRLSEEEG